MLRRLLPSVAGCERGANDGNGAVDDACEPGGACAYCAGPVGMGGKTVGDGAIACALCQLVVCLDRPRIDEEALLIWLPEMSQAALNALMRLVHLRLASLGEDLRIDAVPELGTGDRPALYQAGQALLARSIAATGRLGTARPSELADTLLRLPEKAYARRGTLLGGVRLLPSGRFFEGGGDILPEIVESWREPSVAAATAGARA